MCANSEQPDNWRILDNYTCMLLEVTIYDNNETDRQENSQSKINSIHIALLK